VASLVSMMSMKQDRMKTEVCNYIVPSVGLPVDSYIRGST